MSYFLEDTNFGSMNDTVVVDYTGMNEAMFNAEVAWGAINESAMKTEYQAIKNEDTSMLQEGISDFFAKVKEWFKNMITSIGRVIMNIKNKIILKFNIYDKFANKAMVQLGKVKTDKIKNMKAPSTPIPSQTVEGVDKKITYWMNLGVTTAKSPDDPTKKSQVLANLTDSYRKTLSEIESDSKKASNYSITIDQAVGIAKQLAKLIRPMTLKVKDVIKGFNIAIDGAKRGVKAADQSDKDAVKDAKLQVTILNRSSSQSLNIHMKVVSLMVKYVKKILSLTKSKDSDAKAEKDYQSSLQKMNASYEGF